MGYLEWYFLLIIGFLMSCSTLSEDVIINDKDLLNIDSLINDQVKYIDNNVCQNTDIVGIPASYHIEQHTSQT